MSNPGNPNDPQRPRTPGGRSHFAGLIALVALAVAVAAWFWMKGQPPEVETASSLPQGVFIAAVVMSIAATMAEWRGMTAWETVVTIVEAITSMIAGALWLIWFVFRTIGTVLRGWLTFGA